MADPALPHAPTRGIARTLAAALVAAPLALAGCVDSAHDAVMLRSAPRGFARLEGTAPTRGLFRGREMLRQERYLRAQPQGGPCSIVITEYRGPIGEREVLAAHDVIVRRERLESYGPLEPVTIDGRPAWSWFMVPAKSRAARRTECVAVVSYDSSTFAIELSTADFRLQDPALQQRIVASFRAPDHEPPPEPEFFGFGLVAALVAALLLILTLPRADDAHDPRR